MDLEEQITFYQFGQGVHSEGDLLHWFSQLDYDAKRNRFLILDILVDQLKPTASEIDQAIADNSVKDATIIDIVFKHYRSNSGIRWMRSLPEDKIEQGYRLLLTLFKLVYQRHFASEKENFTNWRYRDLSSPEVVQAILTSHRKLVEDVYNHPSFRSEFVSIAKLWYENDRKNLASMKEADATPEPQTHFEFVSYDEMVSEEISLFDDKRIHSLVALRRSVEKALAQRYGLDDEQAMRLVLEVIERHLRETYHTDLMGEDLPPGD